MRLVSFDLDGTLLRGQTACEAIARGIGRIERMQELEQMRSYEIEKIIAAREEMAAWYAPFTFDALCEHLNAIEVAPGVPEGFALLREHGFKICIASLTWQFAVEWFATRMGVDYAKGTGLSLDGAIANVWPEDKASWVIGLGRTLGIGPQSTAAVGDSSGDIPMLLAAGHGYWVGETMPPELEGQVTHVPHADILSLSQTLVSAVRD